MGRASNLKWKKRSRWPLSKAARLKRLSKLPEVRNKICDLCRDAERMTDVETLSHGLA